MTRTQFLGLVVLAACLAVAPSADACSGCRDAIGWDSDKLPADSVAYSISVMVMLGIPAVLLVAFGGGFYILSRKAARASKPAAEEFDPQLPAEVTDANEPR